MLKKLGDFLRRRPEQRPAPMAEQSAELSEIEKRGRALVTEYLAMEPDVLEKKISLPSDSQVIDSIIEEEKSADRKQVIAEFLAQKELFQELVKKHGLKSVDQFDVISGGSFIAITYFNSLLSGKGVDPNGDREMSYLPMKVRTSKTRYGAFNGKLRWLKVGSKAKIDPPTNIISSGYFGVKETSSIMAIFETKGGADVERIVNEFKTSIGATTNLPVAMDT